jgi:fumarate hydratase class II
MGLIKWAAAEINEKLGPVRRQAQTAHPAGGAGGDRRKLDEQFVVDIFQTGSGTSTNMNANEVIATRANEIATGQARRQGSRHPNDHVNQEQSSNDVIPTAMHVSAPVAIKESLIPGAAALADALSRKGAELDDVVKIGRTHLQDATPIRLGQEISGYAAQAKLSSNAPSARSRRSASCPSAAPPVGTGINSHPDYAKQAIAVIAQKTGIDFVEAANHFEAQAAKDGVVEASGQLKTIAISLTKIANDIRWLASGPRCGSAKSASRRRSRAARSCRGRSTR